LNSVESRQDTVVPKDAGKDSRLRRVRIPATLRYAMLLAALVRLWQIYVMFGGQISLPGHWMLRGLYQRVGAAAVSPPRRGLPWVRSLSGCSSGR
jgi:hypothetical protein